MGDADAATCMYIYIIIDWFGTSGANKYGPGIMIKAGMPKV